jgi:hypothetical protein
VSDFDGEAEFIESVARELRAPVVLTPALDERVMSDVRGAPYGVSGGAPRRRFWLVRPVTLRVSPLGGLLAAAGIAAVAVLGTMAAGGGGDGGTTTAAASPTTPASAIRALPTVAPVANATGPQQVSFVFLAPGASNVSLVGEFNDWDAEATPLARVDARGVWTVTLPLRPGRYLYMFVVDGTEWAPDPAAPVAPDDGFGVPNSVVTVGGLST